MFIPITLTGRVTADLELQTSPALDSRETETMLLHIALWIMEKLKSDYPQSVWVLSELWI